MTEFPTSTMIIRGNDLFRSRKRKQIKKGRPHKNCNLDDDKQLGELRTFYLNLDKKDKMTPIIDKRNNFTKGTIINSTNLVRLDKSRITILPHMGKIINGGKCLLPEETLFMMHKGKLMILYKDFHLSIQETLSILIDDEDSFKRYAVYNNFAKFALRLHYSVSNIDTLNNSENISTDESKKIECSAHSKRQFDDYGNSSNDLKPRNKKAKIELPTPPNSTNCEPMLTSDSNSDLKNKYDQVLDFNIQWDYLKYSSKGILQNLSHGVKNKDKNDDQPKVDTYSCLPETKLATCRRPHADLINLDWVPSESKEFLVNERDLSVKPDSDSMSSSTNSDIKKPQKYHHFVDNSNKYSTSLNASVAKFAHSWGEYNSTVDYLFKEKQTNGLRADILWKGKTKPLIRSYTTTDDIQLKICLNEKEKGNLEDRSFTCPEPCFDIYSRTCKNSSSQRLTPIAKVFISRLAPKKCNKKNKQTLTDHCNWFT